MALTLSKSGITNGSTVQTWHVTQSVDAFTGTKAYDITISGSLILTGSLDSTNGFTGSLQGTSSWAENSSQSISSSYSLVSEVVSGAYVSSGSNNSTVGSLNFIGGYGQISSGGGGSTFTATINELNGKTLGANCFVTVGYSSSVSSSDMKIGVELAGVTLTFEYDKPGGTTPSSNIDFFFNCMYLP